MAPSSESCHSRLSGQKRQNQRQETTQDDGKSKYYAKLNTKGCGRVGEVKSGDRTSSLGVDWVLEEPERGNLEEVSLPLQTRGEERKREHHEGHVSLNNEETQSGRLSENPGVYLGRSKPSMGVCNAWQTRDIFKKAGPQKVLETKMRSYIRHFEAIIIDHNEQQTVADVLGDTRLF